MYTGKMTEQEILQALKNNEPFTGLQSVRVADVVEQPGFDAKLVLQFDGTTVEVYAEIKSTCTPKEADRIATGLSRLKSTRKDAAFALVCPALSPRSQSLCIDKGVDFIDLAGNISISVPGKLLIQRTGQRVPEKIGAPFYRNPFSGKSSRILRVLLQKPQSWTLREVTEELESQTRRSRCPGLEFQVTAGFASRVLRSLEEQLLIARRPTPFDPDQAVSDENLKEEGLVARGNPISVLEPKRLLNTWAEKYKERFRWNLRRAVKVPNPWGADLKSVQRGLNSAYQFFSHATTGASNNSVQAGSEAVFQPGCYAFTSAAASSVTAPYVDADLIDLFVADTEYAWKIKASLADRRGLGPDLRVIFPYDAGVFLYAREVDGVPIVSDVQAYLDLFARGGRDFKQAEYLFEKRIAPAWARK